MHESRMMMRPNVHRIQQPPFSCSPRREEAFTNFVLAPCVVGRGRTRFIFFNVCYFRICMHHTIHVAPMLELRERRCLCMYVCLFGCWTDQINFLCIYTRPPCIRRGACMHFECLYAGSVGAVQWADVVLFFSYTLLCPVMHFGYNFM